MTMARTALDLTDEEMDSYKVVLPKWHTEERREKALKVAHAIAKLLREEFGATKVVAFGSIVDPERFSPWSDIDIAVSGIRADLFYKAVAVSTKVSDDFQVDIVDPEDCRKSLRQAIDQNGIEI
jgi:predicted nucleotidyltransferase